MKEENNHTPDLESLPQAVVQRKKQISIVWLVPIVAILIGGWLAYKGLTEKGPEVTISFKSAEGLEAGKTKLKYKDVEMGQVQTIRFNADLSKVLVTAELVKEAEPHLTESTRFWVVRPRVTASGVSGLGTLFSGAYIGMDPGKEGPPTRKFEGLEEPPVVTRDMRLAGYRLAGLLPPAAGGTGYQLRFGQNRAISDHQGVYQCASR